MRSDVIHLLAASTVAEGATVVDLFSGAGTVASWMVDGPSVVTVDALQFPLVLSRARFLEGAGEYGPFVSDIVNRALVYATETSTTLRAELAEDEDALSSGWEATSHLIADAQHVGSSPELARRARAAAQRHEYELVRLYFARGFFSTRQAIALDSLRRAIDECGGERDAGSHAWTRSSSSDVALAAWLSTASAVANSPGHVAQFLRSSNPTSFSRVRRAWSLDVFRTFNDALQKVLPAGNVEWRVGNRVQLGDAVETCRNAELPPGSLFYADPPYTKDHYSRMYHVLETLYLYDYPDSLGVGRTRSNRHLSDFSFSSKAIAAFDALASAAAGRGTPLVVSYPSNGLVGEAVLTELFQSYGMLTKVRLPTQHSSLGGSSGRASVPAVECLYRLDT